MSYYPADGGRLPLSVSRLSVCLSTLPTSQLPAAVVISGCVHGWMCWIFPDLGHIGGIGSYSSHIWPCCSLQNRPAAVQRSPHNGPSPPCMNPALTNTSWVRERRRRRRRRRDGVFPDLCFVFPLNPFTVTVTFIDLLAHVTSHCLTYSPQFQLYYLNQVFFRSCKCSINLISFLIFPWCLL